MAILSTNLNFPHHYYYIKPARKQMYKYSLLVIAILAYTSLVGAQQLSMSCSTTETLSLTYVQDCLRELSEVCRIGTTWRYADAVVCTSSNMPASDCVCTGDECSSQNIDAIRNEIATWTTPTHNSCTFTFSTGSVEWTKSNY